MKHFIIALFLLSFSFGAIAATVPTPVQQPIITEIPLGVEIRKDMVVMYLICGKPLAISVHSPTGIRIFQGKNMEQKLLEIDSSLNNTGVPVVKTDLSGAYGDDISCNNDSSENVPTPEQDHTPIEEMNKGKAPMWSASYQP